MSVINCDTSRLNQLSSEFDILVNDYHQEVMNVYELINSLTQRAWIGDDAQHYIDIRMKDKEDLERLGNELDLYAQKIDDSTSALNSAIGRVKR